ncbi:hypothetical protein NPIL_449661 [Nephila pilipes]|uniref:Uncharacterized protein n=1 Tax=Nephila pilipes TaxID=299642 RepID=A0A8X6Q606_NEPPI|nr:hypothetical protein NPIL_449661 [Nephila pilipes]
MQSAQNDYSFESENKEVSFINIDSQQARTSGTRNQCLVIRGQKRSRFVGKSGELSSLPQNNQIEVYIVVAKDGKVESIVPEVLGLSSFANSLIRTNATIIIGNILRCKSHIESIILKTSVSHLLTSSSALLCNT